MWRRAALSKRSCVYFETFLVCQRREGVRGGGGKDGNLIANRQLKNSESSFEGLLWGIQAHH